MALLNILRYPDPRLHTVAKPVEQVDDRIRRLIDDMAETMYDAPGIGLAATQVDVHEQVIVIDTSEDKSELLVFINPRLTAHSEATREHEEGCLSVPGIYESVTRPDKITVEALDRNGERFTMQADDMLATCLQHEMDHLQGKVFVQYLSRLKQSRIKNKMNKLDQDVA
ncbi:MAG: peptide deformylase [Burkholderiaceae bacterium]